jgi:hypothetical protein
VPEITGDEEEVLQLSSKLHDHLTTTRDYALTSLPSTLYSVLHESYITKLSHMFRIAAHEGPFTLALDAGERLLEIYHLIYPPNYPQIGEPTSISAVTRNFLDDRVF